MSSRWYSVFLRFQPTYEELKPTTASDTVNIQYLGFQPTYEELKLSCGSSCRIGCDCFQPTYEELKQLFQNESLNFLFGFQPTYEELKPRLAWTPILASTVFSLPTRN